VSDDRSAALAHLERAAQAFDTAHRNLVHALWWAARTGPEGSQKAALVAAERSTCTVADEIERYIGAGACVRLGGGPAT
jgi:hypothetical protein